MEGHLNNVKWFRSLNLISIVIDSTMYVCIVISTVDIAFISRKLKPYFIIDH